MTSLILFIVTKTFDKKMIFFQSKARLRRKCLQSICPMSRRGIDLTLILCG